MAGCMSLTAKELHGSQDNCIATARATVRLLSVAV